MKRIGAGLRRVAILAAAAGLLAGCAGTQDAKKELRMAVETKKPDLDQCYAKALEKKASTEGRMKLWLHVDQGSGRITDVELHEESAVNEDGLAECFAAALEGVQLQQQPPANLRVAYTVALEPIEPQGDSDEEPDPDAEEAAGPEIVSH